MAPLRSHDSLGSFQLDRRAQSLIRGERVTPLRPKAWQVLVHLAQRPGVVVSGRELFDQVWADVAVTPKTLTNVINELRRALAADPHVRIETRHRLGYRLVVGGATAVPNQGGAAESGEAAIFVGRASELQMLEQAWRRACSGQRQVVLVGGFAGVGKTTLLERFAAERRSPRGDGSAAALATQCTCHDRQNDPEPYGPFAEAIEGLVRQTDILPLLQRCAPSWLVRMPWLLPAAEMAELRTSLSGIGLSRVLREGVQLLETIAAERPLLVVLEDLQHADAATLDLLAAMARRDSPARLMLVASFRTHAGSQEVRESIRRLGELKRVTRLSVGALPASEVRAYLEQRLGTAEPGDQLVAAVEAKTGGNALFLKEMVDVLLQRGWLADDGSGWRLTVSPGEIEGLIPDSARSLIGQHARQLQADDLELLEAASMIGDEFIDKILGAACRRPLDGVAMACRRLAEAGQFIGPVGQRLLPDGLPWSAYRFRHDLYRQGVAALVPPARRRVFHERVAQALAHEYATCLGEVAPQLAMHYREAGDWERQLGALDVAVANAMACAAPGQAMRHLEEAIEVGERHPLKMAESPLPAELRQQVEARADRLLLYGSLRIHFFGPGDRASSEIYDRALEMVTPLGSVVAWMRAQNGRCTTYMWSGRAGEAHAIAQAMMEAAEAGHPELLALAAYYQLSATLRLGEYRLAVAAANRMQETLPYASPDVPRYVDLRSQGEALLPFTFTVAGDPAAAARYRDEALANAGRKTAAFERNLALDQAAFSALVAQDAELALEYADRAYANATQFGLDGFLDTPLMYRTWALCRLGRSDPAEFETVLEQRDPVSRNYYHSLLMAWLAELHLAKGDLRSATRTVERIAPDPAFDAEIERIRGLVLAAAGQRDRALACLVHARDLAARQGAVLFERRAGAAIESLG